MYFLKTNPIPDPGQQVRLIGRHGRWRGRYRTITGPLTDAGGGANVLAVAVSWGAFTEDALRVTEPDHLSEDLNGAVDWLLARA